MSSAAPSVGRGDDWGALDTLKRGWRASPELRHGAVITLLLAFLGAGGRIIVPILIQQAIDKGFTDGEVQMDVIVRLAVIAAVGILIATVANRTAVARLATRSEEALYGLRGRAFAHIHQLSIAGPRWARLCSIPPRPPERCRFMKGPSKAQRSPGPFAIAVSMSATVATPISTRWKASRQSAACRRLATWPAISLRRWIGRLPIAL